MKEITVISGKGGAGKTSVTAALAAVAENAVFCDNDVDAADLHLIFQPEIREEHDFYGGYKAAIDTDSCSQCGVCMDYCRFDAIHFENGNYHVNPFQCEGCRLCERVCPEKAIQSTRDSNNYWYVSSSRFGTVVHAKMAPGEENSGKLVSQVRKKAKEIMIKTNADLVINDGPPGIGCTAISSLSGVNLVLLVVEPTKSGLHDVKRLVELVDTFKIKMLAVINKSDINTNATQEIEKFLFEKKIPLLEKIPFDTEFVKAMVEGKTIVEYNPESETTKKFKSIWMSIKSALNLTNEINY